jgi:hypothetical protein
VKELLNRLPGTQSDKVERGRTRVSKEAHRVWTHKGDDCADRDDQEDQCQEPDRNLQQGRGWLSSRAQRFNGSTLDGWRRGTLRRKLSGDRGSLCWSESRRLTHWGRRSTDLSRHCVIGSDLIRSGCVTGICHRGFLILASRTRGRLSIAVHVMQSER